MIAPVLFFVFSAASDVPDEQPVVLDFSEDEPVFIGKSANRQLLITNHTAISASFIIEAEVFSGHQSMESVKTSKHGYDHRALYVYIWTKEHSVLPHKRQSGSRMKMLTRQHQVIREGGRTCQTERCHIILPV